MGNLPYRIVLCGRAFRRTADLRVPTFRGPAQKRRGEAPQSLTQKRRMAGRTKRRGSFGGGGGGDE